MDDQEFSEFIQQYTITGSQQSEILDAPFSPGSQDSISNINLDFDSDFNRIVDSKNLDLNEPLLQLTEVNDYKLHVSFESQKLPVAKSTAWTFSESLDRLFVNISQPCPVRLRLEPCTLRGAFLRCLLRYQDSSYSSDPVTQCANHSSLENDLSVQGHVLRCKEVGVQYEKDVKLGRYSLLFPFDRFQDDVDGGTCVFEFKCLNTCLGRRAMELVFQVEYSGRVVCSHFLNVRVCSCPGRDRRHDEDPNSSKSKLKFEQNAVPYSGPSKRHLDDTEEFTIKVKGRKNYELLQVLKQKLEMADAFESQAAEGKQDSKLASPKPKMLMTTKDRVLAKEQLKDQGSGVIDSADVDRSHHRWRLHHHHQPQQSQNLPPTGKMRKNKV